MSQKDEKFVTEVNLGVQEKEFYIVNGEEFDTLEEAQNFDEKLSKLKGSTIYEVAFFTSDGNFINCNKKYFASTSTFGELLIYERLKRERKSPLSQLYGQHFKSYEVKTSHKFKKEEEVIEYLKEVKADIHDVIILNEDDFNNSKTKTVSSVSINEIHEGLENDGLEYTICCKFSIESIEDPVLQEKAYAFKKLSEEIEAYIEKNSTLFENY